MAGNGKFGLAIVGCGTVGGATALRLKNDAELIRSKTGVDLALRHIVDVDFRKATQLGLDPSLFQKDLEKALADPEVACVVELVGGITVARQVIEKALRAGKHVVTANKALLAHHGPALMKLARDCGLSIAFEASCAGGVPIIRALTDGLVTNRVDALYGIVNGTCNYILTQMIEKGRSYGEALKQAQADGLAEADPTLDVSGHDSAHKLAILASLSFGKRVNLAEIPVEGIDTLQVMDVAFGLELGYVVKLLAVAQRMEEGISLRVRPAFIARSHPLAWVGGPFNAVSVYGHSVGHTMFYGRGAGGFPTSSAILSDVVSVALGTAPALFERLPLWPDAAPAAQQLAPERIRSRYYLRVMVVDRPGVLASLAKTLGDHGISIASVLQREPPGDPSSPEAVPVVITTHSALEKDVRAALALIDRFDTVKEKTICITIVDEHEEKFL